MVAGAYPVGQQGSAWLWRRVERRVELVVPAHLGLVVHDPPPHDRRLEQAQVPLGREPVELGGELDRGDLQPVPPRPQGIAELIEVHPLGRERQRHAERIGPEPGGLDRLLAQRLQLQLAIGGDLVHGPGRPPSHLLGADGLDQALALHRAQFPVERPDGHPAPLADVREVGQPPDLVPVLGPVARERAERHQPSQIHEISIMRLISGCQTRFR
jgi:hypothetical protein